MRRNASRIVPVVLAAGLMLAAAFVARGQDPQRNELRAFMRQKLDCSERILEGLTREDFTMIHKNARRLLVLSEDAQWKVSPNIHYFHLSRQFQTIAEHLIEKAGKKNLDGTTLAYMELTMNCVKCHKLVRDQRLVTMTGGGRRDVLGLRSPLERRLP